MSRVREENHTKPHFYGIARFIRRASVPIILIWVAVAAFLNVAVAQLEAVGKLRSVSMSPDEAPAVISMERIGEVFEEYESSSSAMIVLEGEQPLGDEARAYYAKLIEALEADPVHVEHVQDLWSDPLTAAGAQSGDGKSMYFQVNLAGNQGEALANESVAAVQKLVADSQPPAGVQAYVTGASVLAAEQETAGLLDRVETRVRGVGVDRLRVLTHQAEDDRLVGAVPVAGLPERPAQFDLDARDVVEEPCLAQGFEEPPRGSHRTDGVGRRGSDTDRVQFECTQRHATPSIMRTDSHTMWPHE